MQNYIIIVLCLGAHLASFPSLPRSPHHHAQINFFCVDIVVLTLQVKAR